MPINYSLSLRNTKPGDRASGRKVYARVQSAGTRTLEDMLKLVEKRYGVRNGPTVRAALEMVAECLRLELLDGRRVNLGELGTFHCEITGSASDSPDDCRPMAGRTRLAFKWTPGENIRNIASEAKYTLVSKRTSQDNIRRQNKQELREEMERQEQKRE
ncbi:MAG: hypothetical protein LUC86_07390 [Prevotellaceae bacterium]|nr:hypothetical protein [Prevotellaceae bacterium]